jgi:hypothetical protein
MPGPLKSFEALHKTFNEERRVKSKELFERALKGKFESVAKGEFECKLPPLTSISIIPVKVESGEERRITLNVRIYYTGEGERERACNWNIFEDGVVSGKVPADLPLTHEEITTEIYRIIEQVNFEFWHQTDLTILPESDTAEDREPGEQEQSLRKKRPVIDEERLKFLEDRPDALFGFVNSQNGFNGYHGVVLRNGIILEHPRWGNAAYIVPLPERVPVAGGTSEKAPASRMGDEEKDELLSRLWEPISRAAHTRKALCEQFGATRIVHTRDTWKKRIREAIERLP